MKCGIGLFLSWLTCSSVALTVSIGEGFNSLFVSECFYNPPIDKHPVNETFLRALPVSGVRNTKFVPSVANNEKVTGVNQI